MNGYLTDIGIKARLNEDFRNVLYTAPHMQLVVMSLRPGEDIGEEIHQNVDQFIRVEAGSGTAILDGQASELTAGSVVTIPAGTRHNIVNRSSSEPLKLFTIYAPPQHPDGTVHKTKGDALASEARRR